MIDTTEYVGVSTQFNYFRILLSNTYAAYLVSFQTIFDNEMTET